MIVIGIPRVIVKCLKGTDGNGKRWKQDREQIWKCGNVEMHAGKRCLRKRKDGTWNGENMETGNRWKFTCVVPTEVQLYSVSVREKI